MADSVYQSDPDRLPDSGFLPGDLSRLVAGNRGRLLDPRRTPVHVTAVRPETGFFEVEIDAFEDAGARWLVPLESVASYQFAPEGAVAAGPDLQALRDAAVRAGTWLAGQHAPAGFDPAPFIGGPSGWPQARDWLAGYLSSRGLAAIEEGLMPAYVSNPWAGDLVLGHLVVMAKLGLGTLAARAPRDPSVFAGQWAKDRRAEHILARMGFVAALWSRAVGEVMLYRGTAIHDRPPAADTAPGRESPLVSATFSRPVAESHFGSPDALGAALYRQRLAPQADCLRPSWRQRR
jgi:hypothetical protein